jgi:hypothetical protein
MGRLAAIATALVATSVPAAAQVTGVVRDADSGEPIAGARVSIQASPIEAIADGDGGYQLDAPPGDHVVAAAARGYFTAAAQLTAPAGPVDFALAAVPADDDPGYQLRTPQFCGNCHPQQVDEWTGSPMAQAGGNTWVYDIYDGSGTAGGAGGFVYVRDSVLAAAAPESECAACHEPEAWVGEPFTALAGLDSGAPATAHGV